jgi:hypothetical protein
MITQERALEALKHEPHLAEIGEFEPECIDTVLKFVQECTIPAFRWMNYEILKKSVARFVGRNARCPELRTSAHYEALLAFIDWLLPEMEQAS